MILRKFVSKDFQLKFQGTVLVQHERQGTPSTAFHLFVDWKISKRHKYVYLKEIF